MKRALGALTTWDTFKRMTEAATPGQAQAIADEARERERETEQIHAAEHIHHTTLPHSHEDEQGHKATHGTDERKEHKTPEEVKQ
jgi:hypothetical protein